MINSSGNQPKARGTAVVRTKSSNGSSTETTRDISTDTTVLGGDDTFRAKISFEKRIAPAAFESVNVRVDLDFPTNISTYMADIEHCMGQITAFTLDTLAKHSGTPVPAKPNTDAKKDNNPPASDGYDFSELDDLGL